MKLTITLQTNFSRCVFLQRKWTVYSFHFWK